MDKDALAVIEAAFLGDEMTDHVILPSLAASVALAALGANGYVVVPRHLLDTLLAAAVNVVLSQSTESRRLVAARAAVVEAVGPTREDQR